MDIINTALLHESLLQYSTEKGEELMMHRAPRAEVRGQKKILPISMPSWQVLFITFGCSLGVIGIIASLTVFANNLLTTKRIAAPAIAPIVAVVALPLPVVAVPAAPSSAVITLALVVPAKPAEPTTYVYPVKRDDRLLRIAQASCNDIDTIVRANRITNPNLIYPGQPLTLNKVENCTPETAKLKASPEMRVSQHAAPRDKSLVPVPRVPAPSLHATAKVTRIVVPQNGNCDSLGGRIAGEVKRIVFRADCITERFGAYIAAEVASVKTASLIKAGLVSAAQARNLVLAVIMQESKGNALAVMVPENPKNAISEGLMQVTPDTMRAFGGGSAFNPRDNIHAGYSALTTYTALFVGLPHAIERGLVGYNMGPYGKNRAFLYRSDYDPRGRDYVQKVMHIYGVLESQGYASSKSSGNTEVVSRAVHTADVKEN